jgi:hypothetical protein
MTTVQRAAFDRAVQQLAFQALGRRQELLEQGEHIVAWDRVRRAAVVFEHVANRAHEPGRVSRRPAGLERADRLVHEVAQRFQVLRLLRGQVQIEEIDSPGRLSILANFPFSISV